MWRIFLESLVGLILLFAASIYGYEYLIYGKTDPDLVDANLRVEAFRDIMNHVSTNESDENAIELLEIFAKKTHRLLSEYPAADLPEHVKEHFTESIDTHFMLDEEDHLWLKFDNNPHYFELSDDPDSELIKAIEFGNQVVWLFFLASFVAFSFVLIWFLSRRLRVLEKTAMEFANGNFDARASERHWVRLGKLNRTFNRMATKIANLMVSNKALTNAVAHELRTPIFRIQWQSEILLEQVRDEDAKKQILSIIEDTEDMEKLVDELLYYARVERPDAAVNLQHIDLIEWLNSNHEKWQKDLGQTFLLQSYQASLYVDMDKFLLCRALVNLISNAKRYANDTIVVKVVPNNEVISIEVHDDGKGIEPEHWPMLFEPFYRVDKARDRASGGYGLGLAIVKHIMLRHGGDVEVSHSELGGACFSLLLPVKKEL
ncbi:ATP-binding protein [Vibrio hangzhouensis]|uniref:histidine kinase n=1 Tax=Vibrio hangzhouensis TaxID=462991 RepID=A0A1H5RWA3_9VIBR|nr:ATP-binding protein [Vibrio hangzhouensis]SEF41988.1 two-component system, OmpR family, sensor histidine kinase RstB [Vibrio hangzhouensis]